jgi:hypothetical protein
VNELELSLGIHQRLLWCPAGTVEDVETTRGAYEAQHQSGTTQQKYSAVEAVVEMDGVRREDGLAVA